MRRLMFAFVVDSQPNIKSHRQSHTQKTNAVGKLMGKLVNCVIASSSKNKLVGRTQRPSNVQVLTAHFSSDQPSRKKIKCCLS